MPPAQWQSPHANRVGIAPPPMPDPRDASSPSPARTPAPDLMLTDGETSPDLTDSPDSDDSGCHWLLRAAKDGEEPVFEIIRLLICISKMAKQNDPGRYDGREWNFIIPSDNESHNRNDTYSVQNESPRYLSRLLDKGAAGVGRSDEYGRAFWEGIGKAESKCSFARKLFREKKLGILDGNVWYSRKFVVFNVSLVPMGDAPGKREFKMDLPQLCTDALGWYNNRLQLLAAPMDLTPAAAPIRSPATAIRTLARKMGHRFRLALGQEDRGSPSNLGGRFDNAVDPEDEPDEAHLLRYLEKSLPRNSKRAVQARRTDTSLSWKAGREREPRHIRRWKDIVGTFMHAVSGGDKVYAGQLHKAAVSPPDGPDESNANGDSGDNASAEDHHQTMTKNIGNFVAALHSGGTRDTESQEALDAVVAAMCCTENGNDLPVGYAQFVKERVGTTNHMIKKGNKIANGLMATSADPPEATAGEEGEEASGREGTPGDTCRAPKYRHRGRARRKDAVEQLPSTMQLIINFSHRHSRFDSNTAYVNVTEPDGKRKAHKLCIWDGDFTVKDLYEKKFLQWEEYAEWQKKNDGKVISQPIFGRLLCPCVKKPTGKSCVDLRISAVEERQKALLSALRYCPDDLKQSLKECNCEYHRRQRMVHFFREWRSSVAEERKLVQSLAGERDLIFDPVESVPEAALAVSCLLGKDGENAKDAEFAWKHDWAWYYPPRAEVAHAEDLICYTCCDAVEKPRMSIRGKVPVFVPWKCIMNPNDDRGSEPCSKCGIHLVLETCPVLQNYTKEIKCEEWQTITIERSETATQEELRTVVEPFNRIVKKLHDDLKIARRHYTRYRWSNWGAKREISECPPDHRNGPDSGVVAVNEAVVRVIHTDFAAIGNLTPLSKDNSHVDTHFINGVFMLYSRFEYVPVFREAEYKPQEASGALLDERNMFDDWIEVDVPTIGDCDVYQAIGPTNESGKKQGHLYHNAALKHILIMDDKRRADLGLPPVTNTIVRTDRCPTQYYCQQNYLRLAELSAGDEIEGTLTHKGAEKYHFKGQHDREGKDTKNEFANAEKRNIRLAFAWDAFKHAHRIRAKKKEDLEPDLQDLIDRGDWSLRSRTIHKATSRTYLFASYSQEDFDAKNQGEHEGLIVRMNFLDKPNNLRKAPKDVKKICTFRAHPRADWTPDPQSGSNAKSRFLLDLQDLNCECNQCLLGEHNKCIEMKNDPDFKKLAKLRKKVRIQEKASGGSTENEDNHSPVEIDPRELTVDVVEGIDNYRVLQSLCTTLRLGGRGKEDDLRNKLLEYIQSRGKSSESEVDSDHDGEEDAATDWAVEGHTTENDDERLPSPTSGDRHRPRPDDLASPLLSVRRPPRKRRLNQEDLQ